MAAVYSDEWYIATINTSTLAVTGVYEEDGVVKKFTTQASALTKIQDLKGENECKLVRVQDITWAVTADDA